MTLGRIKMRISHNLQYISGSFAVYFNSILQVSNENPCKLRFGTFFFLSTTFFFLLLWFSVFFLLFGRGCLVAALTFLPNFVPGEGDKNSKKIFKSKSLNIRNEGFRYVCPSVFWLLFDSIIWRYCQPTIYVFTYISI